MGGLCVGGPECFGCFGYRRRPMGSPAAEPPVLENFAFFAKITKFLGYLDEKIMLLKRGLEIGSTNMIKQVA